MTILLSWMSALAVQAQITIGGNVYGGGNVGNTKGNTTVAIYAGDLNRVYGGARMADVQGSAFVHVDGEHASNYIVINHLYGGNDIAGSIGSSDSIPKQLTRVGTGAGQNKIDSTWNAFVRLSTKTEIVGGKIRAAADAKKVYIGQLFGGGNGDYDYNSLKLEDGETPNPYFGLPKPELGKTYLEILGGSIVYAYGGGNNATVKKRTVICLDNPSAAVGSIIDATNPNANQAGEVLNDDRLESKMGINLTFTYPHSNAYQIGRLFGGNNKAEMAIRPRWNLIRGSVRNLYGGGNEGRMTSPEGLLLQVEGDSMVVENVYGGCRKADVRALYDGDDNHPVPYTEIQLDPSDNPNNIPGGYAARVRVLGGHVTNVYGGNDISGNVYGGNTVGILTRIYGNVYGGGNGSYAYTDNPKLKNDPRWGDFYYNPVEILGLEGNSFTQMQSAEALNLFRPNAEQVSILVRGTAENPVLVEGALYVGGNSASLREQTARSNFDTRQPHIKIGSYVTIDNVFLGNNGENMVKYNEAVDEQGREEGVLRTLASTDQTPDGSRFNSMNLKDSLLFAKYMEGCAMKIKPNVLFEDTRRGDPNDYIPYSSQFGSIYCGGNVGSILTDGKMTVDFVDKIIIYNKVVGGCNNANVYATDDFNAEYLGGLLGDADANGDKLELNFVGLKIQPKRWNATKTALEWNTISAATGENVSSEGLLPGTTTAADHDRRLKGGNVYGGCYNTGHVNGNVIINVNASIVDRKGEFAIFDQVEQNEGEAILYGNSDYHVTERRSGVILDEQGMDVLGQALNVFGGGYGPESEIWGSTTVNINKGYVFQVFGGGENGPVGNADYYDPVTSKLVYSYHPQNSCYVNLKGTVEGVHRGHEEDDDDMAEAEFIYGGSFEAPIAGDVVVNLGNGRVFNAFAGSCNADIYGHTEMYIGRNGTDADGHDVLGFPWVRDHAYGGNDLGGRILNKGNFMNRINDDVVDMVHNPDSADVPDVTNASAYVEYIQGNVSHLFGGCYGDYDYTDAHYRQYTYPDGASKPGFTKPRLDNAFVNLRPNVHVRNSLKKVFGAGQGHLKGLGVDSMQNRSYILVEIPKTTSKYQNIEIFGAGANCGLGMGVNPLTLSGYTNALEGTVEGRPDSGSAIIDLMTGQVKSVFGGSYQEGVTRRTVINVPQGATIRVDSIFGGAYGFDPLYPCDVYEAQVNYRSEEARVHVLFGGNNSADRTLYGQVNISAPVWKDKENDYLATVYGAGYGSDTWSQYTEVNLFDGAKVYEVYGGGNNGKVLNMESLRKWKETDPTLDLSLPGYENADGFDDGLDSPLAHAVRMDGKKYNTNVHIHKGATVVSYAYGGGYGTNAVVSGSTYIDLLGGNVIKDMYAGGTSGAVQDYYKAGTFTASATAYVEGGSARNVYGGGWQGDVGYTRSETAQNGKQTIAENIPGETNVVIGIRQDRTEALPEDYGYYDGVPAILRNAYAGGEGGSVIGRATLTMNNGYIGYYYDTERGTYVEKVNDETWSDHVGKDRLSDCGNLFGGGYDDNSSVDTSFVTVWGGMIRNSVFGGGEIATIGRGKVHESDVDNKIRELDSIYLYGGTNVTIYNGHVKRNVFGGGKGYNILGYGGIHGFYTDGYVFGQTAVNVYGGEIGTEEGLASGYGNVFGGGDVGYVYGRGYFSENSRKIGTGSPNHYYYYDSEGHLTEDCKVVVSPQLQIRKNGTPVTFQGQVYGPYDYVPTDYLNTLPADKEDSRWANLYTGDGLTADDRVERGVHIHNAVFAGGNVSSNSESYNNATTVFGNTTATLNDVYHHDYITVGTEHTGGLYGGGNLSLVGGYRELNITNYGTDYYGLDQQISLEDYQKLTNRERAYFKLEYQCQQDVVIGGKSYHVTDRISEEEYNALPAAYKIPEYWMQYGFCSIYAGRLLNTIQRADFCGVFGSRLVLQGAKDRVADVGDATEYTINRIGELSLNQKHSVIAEDLALKPGAVPALNVSDQSPDDYLNAENALHGNYFGIYSVVNYLGGLTSDVHFSDPYRYVERGNAKTDDTETYYSWKTSHIDKRDRNNGTSINQVALASGVYLELTSERSTPKNKIYGDITGVVELDLINVKKDIEGGGYVYARNEHGERSEISHENTLLSVYNMKNGDEALTNKIFIYSPTVLLDHQTSGNFIHRSKRIVDDCYPNNGVYNDGYVISPAHYWFIKGEVYIYDQVVSAYAGSASAYSKEVKIPLTITACSNGRLRLLNIQPSLYAYYANDERTEKITPDGVKVENESMTYYLNDVISWWDWHQLPDNEQRYFVKETRVNVDSCIIDGTPYSAGAFVLEDDATLHSTTAWQNFVSGNHTVCNALGEEVTDLNSMFHSSNNIGHDTGYVLTVKMDSPKDWNDWYSPLMDADGDKIRKDAYKALPDKSGYIEGPTYTLTGASGLYGQREYEVGDVITKEAHDDYVSTVVRMPQPPTGQAVVEPAYVALEDFANTQKGNAIGQEAYDALDDKSKFEPAMVCINTFQIGEESYILHGELVSGTDESLEELARKYKVYNNSRINADSVTNAEALEYVKAHLSEAYYVKSDGLYGGQYYEAGQNYSAIKSWCSLTDARENFDFNYDALDLLIDPDYHGEGFTDVYYKSPYSDVKAVEYDAIYDGPSTLTYYDNDNVEHTIASGNKLTREEYEEVRNDQLHYSSIVVPAGSGEQKVFIVNESLIDNGTPYAKGQEISEKDFKLLSAVNRAKVDSITFQKGGMANTVFYCYETYTPSASFTTERGTAGQKGSVISASVFATIPNYQKHFSIRGSEPTETTTLFVSRESTARDVTSEKILTAVYQYTYYEPDEEGEGMSLVNELHVLNVHLQLESGAPEIGLLNAPPAVLPGTNLGLKAPTVNPGLYEVLTSGWEMFADEHDAMMRRNGVPFKNNGTPLYWYQDQKAWIAFYSKTYLGKTYSNYVPVTVANYHDMDAVMADKDHHLYVDHPDVTRNSKIYINGGNCTSDAGKSRLDLLKDFYDLSLQTTEAATGATAGHALLDSRVKGGANLEFILSSDVAPKAYTDWTPIGNEEQCFAGNLHGDGYTISGLNNSLFGKLCGSVYNLGVTGSFASAGVVDSGDGYVENCWINTTGTPDGSVYAVFGNPSDEEPTTRQLVNCYYQSGKNYKTTANTHGMATAMSEQAFYNGTVAYNLNGFYLNKRYYDKQLSSGQAYHYLKAENDVLSEQMLTGYYPTMPDARYGDVGYVENRYKDGDFIYAGGSIPETYDDRMRVNNNGAVSTVSYAPIWPDDYIFFGQTLTYGYNMSRPHDDTPKHIIKNGNRLSLSGAGNRVYRAPAYYQSKVMDKAHFNISAVLAAKSAPKSVTDTDLKPAYPNMTAIDFAGHQDNTWALGTVSVGAEPTAPTYFYPPMLDDADGLLSITNEGETTNLLVYAPSAEHNAETNEVLTNYFVDPDYTDYYVDDDYHRVKVAPASTVHGHLVQSNLTAITDHLLVDKRDFNCPLSYTFASGKRMWHQRMPDLYVDINKGWETVSLPFTAELVSTQDKGEITHFYSGSRTAEENGAKIGHEYWLREYQGKSAEDEQVFTAAFSYPTATGDDKQVDNTFLWDYYYSKNAQKDANNDTYQTYYENGRELKAYPLLTMAKPYMIGFPGKTYYEFDLSGDWTAQNTASVAPARLDKQVISFVSEPAITIGVSDDELNSVPADGYAFVPNYMSKVTNGYLMNDEGRSFDATPVGGLEATPFRPYFVASPSAARRHVQSILFVGKDTSFAFDEQEPSEEEIGEGGLQFSLRRHTIIVTSTLRRAADVHIVNTAGVKVGSFTIQPGETISTRVGVGGIYMLNADGGRYQKKLVVR
ncbi:hypothetical protein [Xylanibacter brevis]|uniref:hypothetical protein n=1 Tax=Xylanibacter brevis TaxID=83231 RepID=UPI0012DE1293|nr:hypothetical protein [Xylanibacter brevis]